MFKRFFIVCALAALAAQAETIGEQMNALFKERVDIFFKTEGLKRQIEAAVHDPAITSEDIETARAAQMRARFAYEVASVKIAALEREEKDVPQELADALEKAAGEFEAADAALREAIREHPKVKVLIDELNGINARAETIREQYEALQEKQKEQNNVLP